jgi:ribosomal protein S18 acetylase RimI-like enzyme
MRQSTESDERAILTGMDPDTRIHAIEENTAAFLLALGRAGGGEERDDTEITWTIGGSPLSYHNAVVRANPTPETADEAILARRPIHAPERSGAAAARNGFHPRGRRTGHGGGDRHMAATLNANDFGEGAIESDWVGAVYARLGCSDVTPWRHYLGLLNSAPVVTSAHFLGAGAAGIYFVSVHPHVRRLGIGAALTLAPLRAARELGYRVGVLGASALGEPVYRRLGFTTCCQISLYEWSPQAGT